MTLEQIIEGAIDVALSTLRAWLSGEGVTVSDDLWRDLRAQLVVLLRGPGVTHARELVIDDQRSPR